MEFQLLGAIKIKDGLFLGDHFASQDLDFLLTNKITHIINCAAKEIPNHYETAGIAYLSFFWPEADNQTIFSDSDVILQKISAFLSEARSLGESSLIHCTQGLSRSCTALAAYFMFHFKWSLYKTLEFMHSRRGDLEIRTNFFQQLNRLEGKMVGRGIIKYSTWEDLNVEQELYEEELILRNTFLNTRLGKIESSSGSAAFPCVLPTSSPPPKKRRKIQWLDEVTRDRSKLIKYTKEIKSTKNKLIKKSIMKSSNSLINIEDGSDTERGGEVGGGGGGITIEKIPKVREEIGGWREDVGGRKENYAERKLEEKGKKDELGRMEVIGNEMMDIGFVKKDGGGIKDDKKGRREDRWKKEDGGRMEEGLRIEEIRGRREESGGGRREEVARRESPIGVRTVKTQQGDRFGYLKKFLKSENPRKEDGNGNLALSLDEGQKVMEFTNALDFKKQITNKLIEERNIKKNVIAAPKMQNYMQENKFDPTQNINLMSNLLTLNLQLHKQVQSIKNEIKQPERTININNINITTSQISNINFNVKSPIPVRIVKDENRNNISLELKDKLKTINNFASKIRPQRPASPFIRNTPINPEPAKPRLRSASPGQREQLSIYNSTKRNDDSFSILFNKPKWKF